MRFDTDAELDLAVRASRTPLKIVVQRPNKKQRSAGPSAGPAERSAANSVTPPSDIPTTEGYAVGSNVDSVAGDGADCDMVMVDPPGGADGARGFDGDSPFPADDPHRQHKVEIDSQAAFEVETAAARNPEGSMLYQKGSIRLAKRYAVHLTPTQLWRVMALFQVQGRLLVTMGLAPHSALNASGGASSTGGSASSDDEDKTQHKNDVRRDSKGVYVCGQRSLAASSIHRLLVLNGVEMAEEEVGPMLQALRVRPRRLMNLGLLSEDEIAEFSASEGRSVGGPGFPPFGHHMHGRSGGRGGGRGFPHFGHHIHGRGGGRGGRERGPLPPPHFHHMQHPPFMGGCHEGAHGHHPPHMRPPHHSADPDEEDHDGLADWHIQSVDMPPPPPGAHWGMWHGPPGHFHPGSGFAFGHGFGGVRGTGGFCSDRGSRCGRGGGAGRECGRGGRESMAMVRFVEHRSPAPGNDVAQVSPGQNFKKSWLVRNDASTPWPEEVSLVPVSRSCLDLSSPPEAAAVGAVAPGEEAELSVDLVAPLQAGMYEGFWRASGEGRRFGQRLWAKVMVTAPDATGGGAGNIMPAGVEKLSLDDGHKDM